jgi:hypothetical protein
MESWYCVAVIGAKFESLLEISGHLEFASDPAWAAGATAEQYPYFQAEIGECPLFY